MEVYVIRPRYNVSERKREIVLTYEICFFQGMPMKSYFGLIYLIKKIKAGTDILNTPTST
jgi:hypothetical protein